MPEKLALSADQFAGSGSVVVGPAAGNSIKAVALCVATDDGRIDADATANAILEVVEVVEGGRTPKQA